MLAFGFNYQRVTLELITVTHFLFGSDTKYVQYLFIIKIMKLIEYDILKWCF